MGRKDAEDGDGLDVCRGEDVGYIGRRKLKRGNLECVETRC